MTIKQSFLRALIAVCTLVLISSVATAAPPASKAAERSNKSFDRDAEMAQRREVHDWLMSERVAAGRGNPVSVSVTAAEKLEIDTARGEAPERVGVTKSLNRGVSFGDVNLRSLKGRSQARNTGALMEAQDGGYVYTAVLSSPEATGIRVHFTGFRLADDAGLYLYTENGQVFGPYTGRGPNGDGDFWSHTLVGDVVTLQLRHVGPASKADLAGTSFNISGLAHLRPRFLGGSCSYNAECVVNLACASGVSNAVNTATDAVAHMQWVSGPYVYFCSGGLLADKVESSQIPYFLTANHCISRGKDARNLETFFKLTPGASNPDTVDVDCETMTCDDWRAHREDHPQSLRTLGATIRAGSRTSDYTLLELKQPAPGGTQFLGWNTSAVDGNHGDGLYRISHPSGAPQSYSEHVVDTSAGTCSSWPRGNWIYSRDTYGATEGGSSGSPVVNVNGEVVGQLSGGCGTNVNETCDFVSNATVDGAFAAYYDDIASILNPGPVQCTPEEEVCNGVDDDCDGAVDEGDVCSTGGGETGSSCDVDEDCNSGRCKGKRDAKVCK